MKKTLQNTLKVGAVIALMLSAGAVSAQQIATGGTAADGTADVIKSDNAIPGKLNGSVRVIDNKGTIKYLQSKNGLTMVTNTTNDVTTTTWQLGGTLTDDTYIDATGKIFAITGIKANNDTKFTAAQQLAATTYTAGSGFTLMARDEGTGEIKRLLAADLVIGGSIHDTATSGSDFVTLANTTMPTSISKIWVYRNGAKLLAGVDYTVAGAAGESVVTVKNTSGTAPEDYIFNTGDIIEIQWVR